MFAQQFIIEAKLVDREFLGDTRVWQNPSATDLAVLARYEDLRGILTDYGDVYVWHAAVESHWGGAKRLGLSSVDYISFYVQAPIKDFYSQNAREEWYKSEPDAEVPCRDGMIRVYTDETLAPNSEFMAHPNFARMVTPRRKVVEMRTDSEQFSNLDGADAWLAKYTYEALDKWPGDEVIATLLDRYPNEQPLTLYRGMNFRTKDEWDEFIDEFEKKGYVSHGISSWTTHPESAYQFAIVRPTYFPDYETFAQEKAAREAAEQLRGYRGIVLAIDIGPGEGINVNKSRLGHEDEIILPRGVHNARIVQVIKPFGEHIREPGFDINAFIQGLKKSDLEGRETHAQGLYNHILKKAHGELTDASKVALFKLELPDDWRDIHIDVTEKRKTEHRWMSDDWDELWDRKVVFWNPCHRLFQNALDGRYGEATAPIVRKIAAYVWKRFVETVKQYPGAYIEARGVNHAAKLAGRDLELIRIARKLVGEPYRKLNQDNYGKAMSHDEMHRIKKNLELVFRQYEWLR